MSDNTVTTAVEGEELLQWFEETMNSMNKLEPESKTMDVSPNIVANEPVCATSLPIVHSEETMIIAEQIPLNATCIESSVNKTDDQTNATHSESISMNKDNVQINVTPSKTLLINKDDVQICDSENLPDISSSDCGLGVGTVIESKPIPDEKMEGNWAETFVPSMYNAVSSSDVNETEKEGISTKNDDNKSSSDASSSSGTEDSSISDSEDSSDASSDNEVINENPRMEADIDDHLKAPILLEKEPVVKNISVTLPEDIKLEQIGEVSSLIENKVVVVKSLPMKPALNLDSILFLADKTVLGQVYDTFGPVSSPYYVVCFNDKDKTEDIKVDQEVYFVPNVDNLTSLVFATQLEKSKGSDASWLGDREPPVGLIDYSDDEEERNAKKNRRLAKRQEKCDAEGEENAETEPSQRSASSRKPRGRGRGTWSNRSVRYANPINPADEMQSSWANACAGLASRRLTSNFPPSRMPPPCTNPPVTMQCPPPVGMPPFNPMYSQPPPNWLPMVSRPPPPPPSQLPSRPYQSQIPCMGVPLNHLFQPPPPPPPPPGQMSNQDTPMNDGQSHFNALPPPPPPSQVNNAPLPDMTMLFSSPPSN